MPDNQHLSSYARRGFKKVEGWMNAAVIFDLMRINEIQHQLNVHGHVGEIGVHHGKLFILLYLLAQQNEHALAIDIFAAQDLNLDQSGHGDFHIFRENLKRHAGNDSRLKVINGDSTTLNGKDITTAAGGCLRLFSIDGGHLSHIVRHDLNSAAEAICEGGVVILDDYFNPEFPGVSEGAILFFAHDNQTSDRRLVPFLVTASKVYLTTESHATQYIDHLTKADLGLPYEKVVKFRVYSTRSSPIRLTEFCGANVLSYSPDKFTLAYQAKRILRSSLAEQRARLTESTVWQQIRGTKVGAYIRSLADKVAPYS